MWDKHLSVAQAAARAAGEVINHYYREGVAIRHKDVHNLVSDADVEAERAIIEIIRQAFPDHAILAEESAFDTAPAEHQWVIDPLDGTNNFAHRLPQFSVSIAYCHHGVAQCGVVFQPLRDEWYEAIRGQGAFANGTAVHVGEQRRLDEVLIGVGFYYDRGARMEGTLLAIRDLFRQNIHGIRRMGSAALDLCYVGMGYLGAFFEYELSPWDFAAGQLFVEEAGGRVTDCRGEPLPLRRSSLLASNGWVHQLVLGMVRPHLPPD